MPTFQRCTVCYRDVRGTLAELHTHCDAYHYGQSPDLIFPNHGLHYKPMDTRMKRTLVTRGESKMGLALFGGVPSPATITPDTPQIAYVVVKPQIEIIHQPEPRSALESNPTPKQMRVLYTSAAWEELVCQSWVTVKTELQANGDEIAIMERF